MASGGGGKDEPEPLERAEDDAEGIPPADLKIILLGDSAVGKSKLVERFLLDKFRPRTRSTYALTLYRHTMRVRNEKGVEETLNVDFWDTAGQERFATMHPSYYYRAHACILVFDVTRKPTYKHLDNWYSELRQYCEEIPCCVVANKIDVNSDVVRKSFAFAANHSLPLYFVSAADGTNVVRIFEDAVRAGLAYKRSSDDFMAEVLELLDDKTLGTGSVGDPARAKALLERRRREAAEAFTPPSLPDAESSASAAASARHSLDEEDE